MANPSTPSIHAGRSTDANTVGTVVSKAGLSVKEFGEAGPVRCTVFTFDDMTVTMTDEAGVVLYGGQKLYDFPNGVIKFIGAVADLDLLGTGNVAASWDGDFGVGTTTAGNNNALATTEQNVIPTTATPQASTAKVTTANGFSTATEDASVDGTSTAVGLYLNFLVDDADHNGGGITVTSGTLKVYWILMGDY